MKDIWDMGKEIENLQTITMAFHMKIQTYWADLHILHCKLFWAMSNFLGWKLRGGGGELEKISKTLHWAG